MSRELRFVLVLLGSIFGFIVLAGIVAAVFLVSAGRHLAPSSTFAERHRIAARMAAIPPGYRVVSATDFLGSSSATLESADEGTKIVLQSNVLSNASPRGDSSRCLRPPSV